MASAPDIVVEVEASPDVDTASAAPVTALACPAELDLRLQTALRTERYFQERAARASRADFLAILEKAGSATPIAGDELPLAS
ncbi:MAG: hypothetical protein WBR35_09470 [Anaerolineae bacterium]